MGELNRRGLIRSSNNPVADYAEFLVVEALSLSRVAKSVKGHDAIDKNGMKYEIKGRRLTRRNNSRMLSAIRDLESGHFHYLAGVLFKEDFTFDKACLIPVEIVRTKCKYRRHTNAHILELKDHLWQDPTCVDISEKVREVIRRFDVESLGDPGAE